MYSRALASIICLYSWHLQRQQQQQLKSRDETKSEMTSILIRCGPHGAPGVQTDMAGIIQLHAAPREHMEQADKGRKKWERKYITYMHIIYMYIKSMHTH